MAYPTVAFFQGIPSVFALLPSKHQKRRTATSIMAGHFDPLPALPADFERDDASSSRVSSASATDHAEPKRVPDGGAAGRARAHAPKGKGKQGWKRPVARRRAGIAGGAEQPPPPPRVIPAEKATARSDSDSDGSLSSRPALVEPCPAEPPRASGFWRARSSNASEPPAPAATRKRNREGDDEELPERKRTLRRDVRSPHPPAPAAPPANPSTALGSTMSWAGTSSMSSLESEPGAKSDAPPETKGQASSENINNAVQPHIIMLKEGRSRCKLCRKVFRAMHFMERHFENKHPTALERSEEPREPTPPPPKNVRGPRKNVAVRKGWKGWVEEDLEPQKLILLDAPEVLPERRTRSGRKID